MRFSDWRMIGAVSLFVTLSTSISEDMDSIDDILPQNFGCGIGSGFKSSSHVLEILKLNVLGIAVLFKKIRAKSRKLVLGCITLCSNSSTSLCIECFSGISLGSDPSVDVVLECCSLSINGCFLLRVVMFELPEELLMLVVSVRGIMLSMIMMIMIVVRMSMVSMAINFIHRFIEFCLKLFTFSSKAIVPSFQVFIKFITDFNDLSMKLVSVLSNCGSKFDSSTTSKIA